MKIILPQLFLHFVFTSTWLMIWISVLVVATVSVIRCCLVRKKLRVLKSAAVVQSRALQKAEAELESSREHLRHQLFIQNRLITAITHDIKSPLKYMAMTARRMSEQIETDPDPESMTKIAKMLQESGNRMYHLTDNLLQYIKLNGKGSSIAVEDVNLSVLVGEKLEIFADIAADQSTELHSKVPSDLYVKSNNQLLGIILHNLIDNAVKVTFKGEISVSAESFPGKIIIRVEDSGVGMGAELAEWCNGEASAADGLPPHTGFGLIIVKELTALMKGRFSVSSLPSSGTIAELIFENEGIF